MLLPHEHHELPTKPGILQSSGRHVSRTFEQIYGQGVQLYPRPQLDRLLLASQLGLPKTTEDQTKCPHDSGGDEKSRSDNLHRKLALGCRHQETGEAEDGDEDADYEGDDGEEEQGAADRLERRPFWLLRRAAR